MFGLAGPTDPDEHRPYPDSDKTASSVAWLVLVLSGVLEAVWATRSPGPRASRSRCPRWCSRSRRWRASSASPRPCGLCRSGTAYAVWVGIGAALTARYAMWSGHKSATVVRVLLLIGIVARRIWPKVNERRNVPSVDGARTPVNSRGIPPCRSTAMSSIKSAPATIPATTLGTFR